MLSRTVQLFSRKQTLSVVTCLPCDTESFQTCVSNGCGGESQQNTTAQTLCSPKLHPYISSVKIPFAFPRAGTLFTRSPGCSLDPISFGLSHRLTYHMQTRSIWSVDNSVNELRCFHHRFTGVQKNHWSLYNNSKSIFSRKVHRDLKSSQIGKVPVALNSRSNQVYIYRDFCDKTSPSNGDKSDSSNDISKTVDKIESDEVKEWLQEMRDDFKTTAKGSDAHRSTTSRQLEKSTGADDLLVDSSNSSSSSSDSENELDDVSDSELENTAIQEVLDHAEYYSEDGHVRGKGKKTSESQKPVGTDIEDQSRMYSEVSKYAEKVNVISDSKQPEDDLMIDIEEFPDYESDWDEEKPSYMPPIPLTRGKEGVFDLGDLVTLLTEEKAKDICVIRIPEEYHYVDYLVLLTAMSLRHNTALTEIIHWIYKRKKGSSDPTIHIEKGRNWTAIDLGNIALHIMTQDVREEYDIETLWTCGPEYDEKSRDAEKDPYAFSVPLVPGPSSASGRDSEISKE